MIAKISKHASTIGRQLLTAVLAGLLMCSAPAVIGSPVTAAVTGGTSPLDRPAASGATGQPLLSFALFAAASVIIALTWIYLRPHLARRRPPAVPIASQQAGLSARATRRRYEDGQTLAAILRAANEPIVLCDAAGLLEAFNPAAEMMFGQPAEDVIGNDIATLVAGGTEELDLPALAVLAASSNGGHIVREAGAKRRGSQIFPIRLWIRRLNTGERWRLLVFAEDLTEHDGQETQTAYLRQHDLLTGVLNRREFERRLELALFDTSEQENPHALCYIDVDQFKVVNNTCGHAAGDKLLQELAVLLEGKLAGCRLLARIGGDEFAVLFVGQPAPEVLRGCEEVLQTIRNFLFTWQDRSLDIAVSIGLLFFSPDDESASTALSKADVACHVAKHKGRDRLHIYSDGDTEVIRHYGDMHLVITISQALSEGRFRLFAQPIQAVRHSPREPIHYEVLVRMVDEAGQLVIPDRFIPAAERYILMPAVDRWIIQHLFSTQALNLRRWHDRHPGRFLFAVNLSGTSLNDEGFLRYLKRQFVEWDIPHSTICFEITETATIGSLGQARTVMEELGRLGCQFALDDFGAGLSSYLYLRELPVSYLKIDGGFVRGMLADPVNRAIVESMNQIGHVLGLQTIAEWAEDQELINALREIGVDYVQGFGIGTPTPVDGFRLPAPTAHIRERAAVVD